ncbi:group II intron reverse transcriptase/maturase [Carnobacterium jeotgali]|uniref:group II intron reverse transcriptase/maturase n=1 Tax=Carnobacterium jeotgali TaxID=545534 RepID=UPI003C758193
MVDGSRSGKESAVNAGDLSGQDARETVCPPEVRAAIVAQASRGGKQPEEAGPTERNRVTSGGVKGGRKVNASSEGRCEEEPSGVFRRAGNKQEGEDLWEAHKAERGVWSEKMLVALRNGVKGNKWFSLIDKVRRMDVLELAWEKVRSNAGGCGVDGVSVECFGKDSQNRLLAVKEQLERGTYQPHAVKRIWIPKPGSAEKRPLGIPTVRDRVVQTAMRMVMEPIFEHGFAEQSYGFRPGRSCHDALRRVEELLKSGSIHVVDIDIKGYFDAIPRERLMEKVEEKIADGRLLGLIEAFLNQKVMEGMESWESEKGTPQGAVISPLLANIYLDEMDWKLAQVGIEMVRYADDIVLLCREAKEADQAMEEVRQWMEGAGLELNVAKTRVVDMGKTGSHFDFLGYRFWRGKRGNLRRFIRPKSQRNLRERIKPLTKRANGHSMETLVAKLNPILRGWYGYFKHASADALEEVDGWVRNRLRGILRKRRGGRGRGRGMDNHRWGNGYFAKLGLYSLIEARAKETTSLQ